LTAGSFTPCSTALDEGQHVLYLLEPTPSLTVLHNRTPGSTGILEHARTDRDVDLACLDWEPGLHPADVQILLRLALIHGTACSRGLVIDGALVAVLDRGHQLSRGYRKIEPPSLRSPDHQRAVDQWLGIPPSVERRRRARDQLIETQNANDLTSAMARASKLLAGAPEPALLRHWLSVGGRGPG
jgi:hypothetical protein